MRPYALKSGEGWTYRYDIDFTVKAGELQSGRGAAFIEYTTRKGEEPPDHTHPTEDEIFYVLKGEVVYHCDGQNFDASAGSFVFLPKGLQHGYTIKSDGEVHLLVITFPTQQFEGKGWGGYLADVESQGEAVGPAR